MVVVGWEKGLTAWRGWRECGMPSEESPAAALASLRRRLALAGLATEIGSGAETAGIQWAETFLPDLSGEEAFAIFCNVLAALAETTPLTANEQRAALGLFLCSE